jgi:hypothetical protein
MGIQASKEQVLEEPDKNLKFGGYKNSGNPRPGYYITPSEIFYRGKSLENVTPSTFQKLGNSWAKDHNQVYFQGNIITGADSKSFRVENKFGIDKKYRWYRGKKVV